MTKEGVEAQGQKRPYPFERKPQSLAGNFETRMQQMKVIAANPTDQQQKAVFGVIEREVLRDYKEYDFHPDKDYLENAARRQVKKDQEIFFGDLSMLLANKEVIDRAMTTIRGKLSRPGGNGVSLREAREDLALVRSLKRETDGRMSDYEFILREAGVKVAPEHALTTLEKMRLRLYELQKRVVEPGLQLGRNRLQLLVETGAASLKNVTEKEGARLKDISESITQGVKGIFNRLKGKAENSSRPLMDFVSEQEERIKATGQQVQVRISSELKEAVEKGRPILNPTLKSVNSDRENIKRQVKQLVGNLTSSAKPRVSDVSQKVSTFGHKQLEGMRVFGKNILNTACGKTSGVWNFLKEQAGKIIIRANESRQRLNRVLDNNLGQIGTRFRTVSSSASFKVATINEDANWWLEDRGYDAKEGFIRTAEWIDRHEGQVAEAVEAVRAYWSAYAVARWQEMGLAREDIKNRIRLFNTIGSTSIISAAEKLSAVPSEVVKGGKLVGKGALRTGSFATGATLAAWDGASLVGVKAGAEAFKFLGEHKKLRMGLAVGAPIALVLLSNPHMIDNITGFLQQGLGGGLNLAAATGSGVDLASNLPSVDGGAGIISSGNYSPTIDVSSINTADMGNQIAASDPSYYIGANIDAGAGSIANAPAGGGEVTVFDHSSAAGVDTLSASDGMNHSLSSVNIAELVTKVQPGQPAGAQIAELAKGMPGDTQENIQRLMKEVWEVHGWNFESTSRAILDGTGGPYTDTQVKFAQRAADAADLIKRDPSSATQRLYEYAMHYWRPGAR